MTALAVLDDIERDHLLASGPQIENHAQTHTADRITLEAVLHDLERDLYAETVAAHGLDPLP